MFITVISLIVIVSVLLVLVVLAQNSKGGGLSSQFGGASASQMMGVKKTGDLLEKVTWGLAIALLALSLSTNLLIDNNATAGPSSPNVERARQRTILPEFTQPTEETTPTPAPITTDTSGNSLELPE